MLTIPSSIATLGSAWSVNHPVGDIGLSIYIPETLDVENRG
ncbi:hypothetical protein [Prevotella communis]|nr:hypothetical protein [Prevotella communis]